MIAAFSVDDIAVVFPEDDNPFDEHPLADIEELVLDEDNIEESSSAEAALEEMDTGLNRNPCLAHLLQLAIKDAIRESEPVTDLIKRANSIVNFFTKSNHYYTKLKEINGNMSLIKPCTTRWNSQFHCLKRIISQGKNKVCFHFQS